MLIGDIIRLNAHRFKDKIAFRDEEREKTFAQANKRANAICNALREKGLSKGDRVAVLLYNCSEYEELLFALPKSGLVLVPLNYRLVGRELTYIINNSEANTIIFGEEFADTIDDIRSEIDGIKHYIVVGKGKTDAIEYESLITKSSSAEPSIDLNEDDTAYILYTSGTTGLPKGAMLTHKNIITNLINQAFELQPSPQDLLFNLPPLYHCAGQCTMMSYFFYGCPSITRKQFDPGMVLKTIEIERPNVVHLVPAMQNMVINHPEVGNYDLSSVQLIIYGAAPMLISHLRKSMEIFGCQFIQFAGQTEAGPILTALRPEDHMVDGSEHFARRLGSAGKEVKLTEVKIVDKEGNELPPDTLGEQVARGKNIMKGYWRQPEATEETIVNGWLHTGDICLKDEGGYVYYVDRIKDMIVRGGENVYSREIEEVIATHKDVQEIAVIGVPDDRVGEEVMAVIVPRRGQSVSEEDIVQLCEKNLARYKKPRRFAFVKSLPKNPSGKILKRELRKEYGKEE